VNVSVTIDVSAARKRGHFLVVDQGDDAVVLHSRYDPIRQAENWAEELTEQHDKILLVGGGLGYLPEALEERGVHCSIVEVLPEVPEDVELPIHLFRNRDRLVEVDPSEPPVNLIDRLSVEAISEAKVILHPGYEHLLPDPDSFLESLRLMSRGKLRNVQSRYRFFNQQFSNLIEILPDVESMRPIESLRDQYGNQPVVVAGAGPSLSDAFEWLNQFQDRMVIVAVDSAYTALVSAGVEVDFVITLDPQPDNAIYVDNTDPAETLVTALTATPAYTRWAESETRYGFLPSDDAAGHRLTSSVMRWFSAYLSGESHLQSGGSITSTAIDFVRLLGSDPICLTGVDHAFTHHRAVAKGTKREEQFVNRANRFQTVAGQHLDYIFETVPGSGKQLKRIQSREGHSVYTMDEYEVQNNWFEQAVEVLGVECLDMRSDGHPMEGWELVEDPAAYFQDRPAVPAPDCSDVSTFDVDWSGMDRSLDEIMDQYPDSVDQFKDVVHSGSMPEGPFWQSFVKPLFEYVEMEDERVTGEEVKTYYRKLGENLRELRKVVERHA
jgi:hypothetical protein